MLSGEDEEQPLEFLESSTRVSRPIGKSWQGSENFMLDADAGPAGPPVVVDPEDGSDTVDPPTEYLLDVTNLMRTWLDGKSPNHGLAIAPVIDPAIDQGTHARFQIFSSEHTQKQYTPKLSVDASRAASRRVSRR